MNNKEIGFDVFENSDVNTIEEIGTEKMNIDKNSRDRMLKITMDKYAKNKKELGLTEKAAPEKENYSDEVTSVEKYSRSKIRQFVYISACSAAAVALIAGSVFMLGHNKKSNKNVQDPLVEVTTSTTITSETVTTTAAEIKSTENVSTTAIVSSTEITTVSVAAETTAIVTETSPIVTEFTNPNIICSNSHPDRTDITNEEIDKARIRILDKLMDIGSYRLFINPESDESEQTLQNTALWDINYALIDVNGDSIPELFVQYDTIAYSYTNMLVYDGSEFVLAKYKCHLLPEADYTTDPEKTSLWDLSSMWMQICPEENLICLSSKEGFENENVLKIYPDNTIETVYEFDYKAFYVNGELIHENSYESAAYDELNAEHNKHNWKDIEFTKYADKNEAAIKFEEENGPFE